MDKKYVTLFKDLAQATAASAESVMDYDRSQNDEKGLKTATIMRDDFQDLVSRLDVTEYVLTKNDAAKLLAGAYVQMGQLKDRIENFKKAIAGYQSDLIPKLLEVVESKNDEDAARIANEKFIFEDNK